MACVKCGRGFERHVERRSFNPIQKKYNHHLHHGIPFYRYGVCPRNHFTRLERTHIEWSVCLTCVKRGNSLDKKRKYMMAKKRKEKKEIPSFLRDTLDEFKKKKDSEPYSDIYDREVHKEDVRREITEELRESIRKDVIRDIKKDLCIKIYNSMKDIMRKHVQQKVNEVVSFDYGNLRSISQPSSPKKLKGILKNAQSQPSSPVDICTPPLLDKTGLPYITPAVSPNTSPE